MSGDTWTTGGGDVFLENFAAELTEAAYPVMLRHGAVDNWLDLELELWKRLKATVRKWNAKDLGPA